MKQIRFGFIKNAKTYFGGEHLVGKRKSKRPLSIKKPIHLVLRSMNFKIFRPKNQSLERLIHQTAKESGVKIYELAINWSHIHFVIKIESREAYVRFVRVLNSKLALALARVQNRKLLDPNTFSRDQRRSHASIVSSASNTSDANDPNENKLKLFTLRPFTRILEWGRDYKNGISYLKLNQKEARGEFKRGKKNKSPNLKLERQKESTPPTANKGNTPQKKNTPQVLDLNPFNEST